MCLAIPHKIVSVNGENALAAAGGACFSIRIDLTPDVQTGDSVLVHAGFAIEKLDYERAAELEALWAEIARHAS